MMKFVTDLSKGVLGTPDSPVLWTNILSNIPDSLLLKSDFKCLVVACGHCTEAVLLVKRMQSLGIPDSRIQDAIWVLDKYHVFTNQARKYGFKNIITADFLLWDPKGMKFDLCLSNPPYQDPLKPAHKYWSRFLVKSFEIGNIVCFIAPKTATLMLNGLEIDHVKLNNFYLSYYNGYDVEQYFPGIGSSFCSFIIQKTERYDFKIKTVTGCETWKTGSIIPFNSNKITSTILSKTLNFRNEFQRRAARVLDCPDGKYAAIETIHTNDIVWTRTNKIHKDTNKPKLIYPSIGKNHYLDKLGEIMPTTSFCLYIAVNSEIELSNLMMIRQSTIFQFLEGMFSIMKSPQDFVWMSISKVDLTRTWTDQELYAHFGLTEEEIQYIEEQVK